MRLFLLALVLALPVAGAAPTTLYAHINGFQDFPMATLPPPEALHQSVGFGVAGHSTSCLPDQEATTFIGTDRHVWYGFGSGAGISYGPDGQFDAAHERGIGADIVLDPDAPATFHWYLATHTANQVPTGLPTSAAIDVVVRQGDGISIGHEAMNAGPIVASGSSEAQTLLPGGPGHSVVDGRDVYHFEVPLDVVLHRIEVNESYAIRIDARLEGPLCQDDGKLMFDNVALHTSPDHRPRLEWTPVGMLDSTMDHAFVNGTLHLWAEVNSAFGAADVTGVTARLVGPAGEVPLQYVGQDGPLHCHCYPTPPAAMRWQADVGSARGVYTWDLFATNIQGTEELHASQAIEGAPEVDAPAGAIIILAIALLGAALRRRT